MNQQRDACVQLSLQAEEAQLWGVEHEYGSRHLLRVYAERPEGLTVGACARISRHLRVALQAECPELALDVLEVSSPGLDRRFFKAEQAAPYLGRTVQISWQPPGGERVKTLGILLAVEGPLWRVRAEDGQEHDVNFEWIAVARLVP